jgi:hypothetical protein
MSDKINKLLCISWCMEIKIFQKISWLIFNANLQRPTRFPYLMMVVSFNNSTTCVTCEAGTANASGAHEFTPVISRVRVAQSLVFCVVFCRSWFSSFFPFSFLVIVLYVLLRITASDYHFDIIKLFSDVGFTTLQETWKT